MLILAGVSLNAIIGDNGVLTKAQEAKIASDKISILEDVDTELIKVNTDTVIGDSSEVTSIFKKLIEKGALDTVLCSDSTYKDLSNDEDQIMGIPNFNSENEYTGFMDYSAKKDNYDLLIRVDNEGIYKAEFGKVNLGSGGSVSSGLTLVTTNAFNNSGEGTEKGKFTITNNASVMFVDKIGEEINGKVPELSIWIKGGITANVYVFEDMILTNEKVDRSAIDIEPGSTLNLWIKGEKKLTVNSGIGKIGETATGLGAKGGPGGYAGIHVPEGATLNLKGYGIIEAIGGNAGDGGGAESNNTGGGRRRWRWSWNRWFWW